MGVDRSSVVLTKSEAACLKALGSGLETKSQIAIAAKLDLPKTSAAMEKLERLGFATRDEQNRWHPTEPGASSCFKTVADKKRRNSDKPGRSGERLLKELDRPMRGEELAARLGLTRQRVHQLVIKLYSRGYVRFADGKRIRACLQLSRIIAEANCTPARKFLASLS